MELWYVAVLVIYRVVKLVFANEEHSANFAREPIAMRKVNRSHLNNLSIVMQYYFVAKTFPTYFH